MKRGTVVESQKGHDKGRLYVVIELCENYALLCDGKRKTLSGPKKKNIGHIADTGKAIELSAYSPLYDAHIKKELLRLSRS